MAKKSKIWEHFFDMFVIFVFVGHHFSFATSLFRPALIVIIISIFINIYIFLKVIMIIFKLRFKLIIKALQVYVLIARFW